MGEITKQEFWKEFIENVKMVADFRIVCEEITAYIEKHGTQDNPDFKAAKEVVLDSYLANEDYESCQRLNHPFKSAGTQEDIAKLKKNISIILGFTISFADNCDICYDVLRTNGMLAFDSPFP